MSSRYLKLSLDLEKRTQQHLLLFLQQQLVFHPALEKEVTDLCDKQRLSILLCLLALCLEELKAALFVGEVS